jgi:hypothetical protein
MKLGKFELTSWQRCYRGWSKYNVDYVENPMIAIWLYHNFIPETESNLSLPPNAIYYPTKKVIWTIQFSHAAYELTQLYNSLYEPEELDETEIKNKIDKFIIRFNKLIIFT